MPIKKKIEFNKVTVYSKISALVLFLFVVPVLSFYIGTQFQLTIDILNRPVVVPQTVAPVVATQGLVISNQVSDPVRDYVLQHPSLASTTKIYSVRLDINSDKKRDTLVTDETAVNGKVLVWTTYLRDSDNAWHLFVPTGGNTLAEQSIQFSPAALGYVIMPNETKGSVLGYVPNGTKGGLLTWSRIEGTKIISKSMPIDPLGKDKDLYHKYIRSTWDDVQPPLTVITTTKASVLK